MEPTKTRRRLPSTMGLEKLGNDLAGCSSCALSYRDALNHFDHRAEYERAQGGERMITRRGGGRTPSWTRLAGLCGLGWFVLFAIGGIILQGEPPAYDEPIAEAREFFADHGQRYLVGDYLADIAFVFLFLPFIVGLRSHLGAAEKGGQIGSRLVFAGGLATVVVGAASTAFLDAVALAEGGSTLDDSTIRALLYADAVAIAGIGMPAALTSIAAAVVIRRTRALPLWLAPVGAAAGALLLIGVAFPIERDADGVLWTIRFVGFISFVVFVVLTSICLIRSDQAESSLAPLPTA
jgi:hypothetical protein